MDNGVGVRATSRSSVVSTAVRDESELHIEQLAILEPSANVLSEPGPPPNGGYGWLCTLGVFLINAHTWGVDNSWAVILAYFSSNDTHPGATHLEYALIGGLSISQALMISPLVHKCQARLGVRTCIVAGAVLEFLALLASSYARTVWQLFLAQGFCFGWGMGFLYIPASATLPAWFSSRRSLAVGAATSGAGVGGLIYSLITNAALEKVGVAWTYRILAFCALAANLAAAMIIKEYRGPASSSNQQQPPRNNRDSVFRLRDFTKIEVLLVICWGLVTELGYVTLLFSLPSYATSIGLTATQGSIANALLNLGLAVGRPMMGYFSDRLGRINMALLVTALCGVWCFALWIPAESFALLAIFAFLSGALCGVFWCSVTPILAEVVGLNRMASTFGVILLAMVLPTTFAEPVAMQIVDSSGSETRIFLGAQVFVGCMFLAGSFSLLLLRAWKISSLENEEASPPPPTQNTNGTSSSLERLSSTSRKGRVSWLNPKALIDLRRV
ncbi:major facilitator superfamily domain-containing protein [Xylariales sp. PMI_506]|nr:major facilitator superfamily domain-containing protein [Xylariales sp. PMI_506]